MTRKEVCRATGLSVKTLRLYEEKGLIAPAREYRNGREYRAYTPELVEQLEEIATLRRALFTMEEIKTMQEQPEKIPGVFQDYQLWLRRQERQIQQLRQAADGIRAEELSSMEDLLSGLRGAAETMPLPAADIKPNFKRLDELDEGPLHVEEQVDLDDMVPNAKVFRQMTVTVDRDRHNDVNMAFGQLQATRDAFREETGTGPVQGTSRKNPKWYNALTGLLMVLTVLFACLAYFGRVSWIFPGIFLVLCAALLALPLWREHRAWLKKAQQEDAGATSPNAYETARKKRIRLICAGAAGVLILALGIYALAQALYAQEHPQVDYRVCFVSPANIAEKDLLRMEHILAPMVGDLDGNGEPAAAVDLLLIRGGLIYHTEDDGDYRAAEYLQKTVSGGTYTLYFMTDLLFADKWDYLDFKFRSYCRQLPPDIADEDDPYRVTLHGVSMLESSGLGDLTVYGCISQAATDEEYEFAVELLRKLIS